MILAVCAMAATIATAQQANLNLEGFVRDESTGQPVGCKIFIFTPSGKRISISSNSKDGSYLQTLSEAGTHKLALSGYNIYRKEVNVEIPVAQKYRIIKNDITVRSLVEGASLGVVQHGFDKNSSNLSEPGRKQIAEVADILRANQEMNVVISIAPDEDQLAPLKAKTDAEYKKQHDAWAKAVKKVKKGQTPPEEPVRPADPSDPNVQLVQERITVVKQMLKDVKSGDVRITYVSVPLPASLVPVAPTQVVVQDKKTKKPKKGATKASPKAEIPVTSAAHIPTLTVKVGKVKKLYD
ncbi:MAG TPA: hypothetical protein VK147_05115 [Candidatus Didemnitutus sp.]|nr:hypothetical protein [Candidatus Didemnitutus sp.]